MKKPENQEVEFQMVIRPIPGTDAYSVILGEIVDGQFQPTDRLPLHAACDWVCAKENPLASNQRYVLSEDLIQVVRSLAIEWDFCVILPGFIVFTVKDFPDENPSQEKE